MAADLKPAGRYVMKDLGEAGGVPLLMKALLDGGYLHGGCITVTGRTIAENLASVGFDDAAGRYRLMTLRSNDQFNTTIYGYSDRLRGIEGTRDVLLMNPEDIAAAGLSAGQLVGLASDAGDGVDRQVGGLAVTPFLLPRGCLGAYYPEMNPLIPLWYHDEESKTPAAKGVPVRIVV